MTALLGWMRSCYPGISCFRKISDVWCMDDLPVQNGNFPYKSPFSYDFPMVFLFKMVIFPTCLTWGFLFSQGSQSHHGCFRLQAPALADPPSEKVIETKDVNEVFTWNSTILAYLSKFQEILVSLDSFWTLSNVNTSAILDSFWTLSNLNSSAI